jgi:hypothetical protein
LPWLNITECEIQFAIDTAYCGSASGDVFIADSGMPKFNLRVNQPRLCPHVFVLGVCRVTESSEQMGDVLILLEYLPHLAGGIAPIPTEFASKP